MKKTKKCGSKKLPKYNIGNTPIATPILNSMNGSVLPTMITNPGTPSGGNAMPMMNNIGAAGNIMGSAANFAGATIASYSDPNLSTPNTYISKGPIQYQKTDYVNQGNELSKLKKENTGNALKSVGAGAATGAALGSVIPGIGTVIGGVVGGVAGAITGIFGARRRRKKLPGMIKEANTKISRNNAFNLAESHSNMIEQEYYNEYEDTQDDALYNKGKTPFTDGKNANALVGKGETIVDGQTGDMTEVTSGSAIGTDDVPAIVNTEDAVAGNKRNPRTGNTFAQDMKPLTRMESRLKRNTERNIKSIAANTEKLVKSYTQPLANTIIAEQAAVLNNGKTPKYNNGKTGQFITEGLTSLATIAPSMWNIQQGNEDPEVAAVNQLYATNAYAQPALRRMAKRRYNASPELEAINSLERRQRYAARSMGSEGGINRAMDMAGTLGLARQTSEVYARKQNVDNEYIGQEANMMAQLGAQEAANQSNAMRTAYDINAKNRATKKAYTQAGITGLSNYAQQLQLNTNRNRADNARLRILEQYLNMGTTRPNIDYLLGPLMNQ